MQKKAFLEGFDKTPAARWIAAAMFLSGVGIYCWFVVVLSEKLSLLGY